MADCYGCPYRWHDEDCEYCGAQGDMILDSMSIKKENCPYYIAYMESTGRKVTSSSSSSSSSSYSSSSSSGFGCGTVVIIIIALMVLGGIGLTVLPNLTTSDEKAVISSAAKQKTAIVYNVNYSLNMREAANSDSNVITTVPKGQEVIILEEGTAWHYVQYGEYKGYCAAECLQIQ